VPVSLIIDTNNGLKEDKKEPSHNNLPSLIINNTNSKCLDNNLLSFNNKCLILWCKALLWIKCPYILLKTLCKYNKVKKDIHLKNLNNTTKLTNNTDNSLKTPELNTDNSKTETNNTPNTEDLNNKADPNNPDNNNNLNNNSKKVNNPNNLFNLKKLCNPKK